MDSYDSLFSPVNKLGQPEGANAEGALSPRTPELDLKMGDDELLALKRQWEGKWAGYAGRMEKIQRENEDYWKGKHWSDSASEKRPLTDNRLFSALETFLPIVTRQNPEPLVNGDNTEASEALAAKVQKMLAYQADIQKLRLKIKKGVRLWALYLLGCWKVGWDFAEDDILTVALRPQRLILDPDATVDEDGYTGEYIGEFREDKASILARRFPPHAKRIESEADGKMGTKVGYTEWWTDDYVFWAMGDTILGKARNPHWDYGRTESRTDEMGQIFETGIAGRNHFISPKKPYVFLSVFNTGLHPHDDTSPLAQNLSLQDLINRRMRQINQNVDAMNGGVVISGDLFTKEQAAEITGSLRKGSAVMVPGNVNEAFRRDSAPPLPPDVFHNLADARSELDNLFGTHAVSRGERQGPETATGKILLKGGDESRASMVTDYVEQAADAIYNWWVQLMAVYYDEGHAALVIGADKAKEYVTLRRDEFQGKLLVSVREGSLIPRDPLLRRNEAIDLWSANAISPVELFEKLDWSDPRKSAESLLLWQQVQSGALPPQALFPDFPMPQGIPPQIPIA